MTEGDKSVVYNLRHFYKEKLASYSDEHIAKTWREFSQSDDYLSRDEQPHLFLEWCES